jgi:hypothetical protein
VSTAGYSENARDIPLEIGHLAGLRWFSLSDSGTSCGGGTVTFTSGIAADIIMACSCGSALHASGAGGDVWPWLRRHYEGRDTGQIPVLRGAYDAWVPGENIAVCRRMPPAFSFFPDPPGPAASHTSPQRGHPCHCGFWAYWKLGAIVVDRPAVAGLVHGYGHTLEGDAGFRCSHIALKALYVPTPDLELQLAVEDRYEVPVYNSLAVMLKMHPAPPGQPPLSAGDWTEHTLGHLTQAPASGRGYAYSLNSVTVTASGSISYVAAGGGGGTGAPSGVGGGSGWSRHSETALEYARRIGMAGNRCSACGAPLTGGACAHCASVRLAATVAAAGALAETAGAAVTAIGSYAAQVMTPIDALAALDRRKASWEAVPGPATEFPAPKTGGKMSGKSASLMAYDETAPAVDALIDPGPGPDWSSAHLYTGPPYGIQQGTDADGSFSPMSLGYAGKTIPVTGIELTYKAGGICSAYSPDGGEPFTTARGPVSMSFTLEPEDRITAAKRIMNLIRRKTPPA